MNFNKDKHFGAFRNISKDFEADKKDKQFSEEEVLNSNNVELVIKYAKENRSKEAINKVRELLEFSRRTGELAVLHFLYSFKECEKAGANFLDFEKTEEGKEALEYLAEMPEPFKTNAYKKLEDFKKELKYNTELIKSHNNNPEEIWKEVFGFDYYNVPEFKERFKTFLFKDIAAIYENYYKKNSLEVKQDPFAINFYVEDQENFDKAYSKDIKDAHNEFGGFSRKLENNNINVINTHKNSQDEDLRSRNEIVTHEAEHVIHRVVNPIKEEILDPERLYENLDFETNKGFINHMRFDFEERLKLAKDEIFAYLKGGAEKDDALSLLTEKNGFYDYNKSGRDINNILINDNKYLSTKEKQQLKEAINFLQTEYDRVLINMINVIYGRYKSVEFFRNVPINEFWKYTDGLYQRTDFIIKEFKF